MICWIYDLDGVVTHLTERKITNPQLLDFFVRQLQDGDLITINTGRGLEFIHEKVLTPLLIHLQKQNLSLPAGRQVESLLNNFFAVGEKGNAWIEDEKDNYDMSFATPSTLSEKAQKILEEKFSDTMVFDTTKKTMISTEFHRDTSLSDYAREQKELVPLFENLLREEHLENDFKLDPNISAVDIQHISAGKALGTKRILAWIEKQNVHPDKFVSFGDSKADLGTGEELQKQGKKFTFVFVGEPNLIGSSPSFPVVFTKEKFDEGVVEYLENTNSY